MKNLLKKFRQSLKCEQGSAVVEIAVVAPLLIAILTGIADYGLLVQQRSETHSAARIGSQYFIAGGESLDEAAALIMARYGDLIESSEDVTVVRNCECQAITHACNVNCPDGDAPDVFAEITVRAQIETIYSGETYIFTDKVRVR